MITAYQVLEFNQVNNNIDPLVSSEKVQVRSTISIRLLVAKLLEQKSFELDKWLDILGRALSLFKPETPSSQILDAQEALEQMHRSLTIWKLGHQVSERHHWQHFLRLYFSLPDRLSVTLNVHTTTWFHPQTFVSLLFRDTDILNSIPITNLADILGKCYSLGSINICIETFLRNEELLSRLAELALYMSKPSLEAFLKELFHLLQVYYHNKPSHLYQLVAKTKINTFIRKSDALNVFISTCYPVLACFFWQDPPDQKDILPFLTCWSIKSTLLLASIPHQISITQQLLVILSYSSLSFLQEYDYERILLEGIQRRLDSGDRQICLIGQVVAECFALLNTHLAEPVELKFELDTTDAIVVTLREAFFYSQDLGVALAPITVPRNPATFQSAIHPSPESSDFDDYARIEPSITGKLLDGLEQCNPIIPINSQHEEARNAKIRRPRFLRDCLAYLKSEDFTKVEMAFTEIPHLLPASSMLLKQEIGVDLFRVILFLGEDYALPDYTQRRQNILIHLLMELPEMVGAFLVGEIKHRRASLLQKIELIVVAMQAINFASKGISSLENYQKSLPSEMQDVHMKIFAHQMNKSETIIKLPHPSLILRKLVNNVVIDLLKALRTCESVVFSPHNNLLLEKILYLLGLALLCSNHTSEWEKLLNNSLTFIEPLTRNPHHILERPVAAALVAANYGAIQSWPVHCSVLPYLEHLAQIAKWLQENLQLANLEHNHVILAAFLQLKLNELCDPQRVIKEVLDKEDEAYNMNKLAIN